MALTAASFKNDKDWKAYLRQYVAESAQKRGIPAPLAYAIAEQESSWNPNAVGKPKNGSVDAGLMQINSINWPSFGIKSERDVTGDNWQRGVDAGMDILSRDYKNNKGNIPNTLVSYNAGPGRLKQFQATGELPDITRAYVPKVVARMQKWGGAPMAQGDFDSLYAQFNPRESQQKILKAAGINGMPQQTRAAPVRTEQPVPTTSPMDFNLMSADAGMDAMPEPQQAMSMPPTDDNPFAAILPQQIIATAPPKRDLARLRKELDQAFNAEDEFEMSSPMKKYLEGIA